MATASDFGKNVQVWRERRGWSMGMLADRSGVARSTISKLESGMRENAGSATMRKLARALDVPMSVLAGEDVGDIPPSTIGSVRLVPLANVRASAGGHSWALQGDSVTADDRWAHGRDLVAYEVSGECMDPIVPPGSIVLVDRASTHPTSTEIVLVLTDDGPEVKRYIERTPGDATLVDEKGRTYSLESVTILGTVREIRIRT
jgi:transcriptional regulator with XRE-family HTH domain